MYTVQQTAMTLNIPYPYTPCAYCSIQQLQAFWLCHVHLGGFLLMVAGASY